MSIIDIQWRGTWIKYWFIQLTGAGWSAWKMTSNSSANVPQTNDASKICEGVNPLLMQEMESEEKKEIQK